MILNGAWWIRRNSAGVIATNYPSNPEFARKFSKQYGGEEALEFEIPSEFEGVVSVDSQLLSVYENRNAQCSAGSSSVDDLRRFKVLIYFEGWREFDSGYTTFRDANASAKILSKLFRFVAVVRRTVSRGNPVGWLYPRMAGLEIADFEFSGVKYRVAVKDGRGVNIYSNDGYCRLEEALNEYNSKN